MTWGYHTGGKVAGSLMIRFCELAPLHLHPSECWPWPGSLNADGYGRFYDNRIKTWHGAHRIAYELMREPIPGGLTIDHLCRNRRCVNPDHMELVSRAENLRRSQKYRRDRY